MHLLTEIIRHKKQEVAELKNLYPVKLLEKSPYFRTPPLSLRKALLEPDSSGIIAEFKRKSPARGWIHAGADTGKVTSAYVRAGAAAVSVLTDDHYFGGNAADLTAARRGNYAPVLRKDFLIDPYQIIQAKAIGADVVLLIAAALDKQQYANLARLARELGLEVLLEIHEEKEIDYCAVAEPDLLGVNNRDLKTLTVSLENSIRIAEHLPASVCRISESGITKPEDVLLLRGHGYRGFLIGETFMQHPQPGKACRTFIENLQKPANAS